jgi:uncharacterized protein (UPF0212 family)
MKELRCPQCGSTRIVTERRPDGYHKCVDCRWSWTNGAIAVAGVNGFSFGPTTEKSSAVDKLKSLRETLQREAPNALADLSMTDDEYSGVEEWARCCPACGQRNDCEHKLLGWALVKIELLNEHLTQLETKANIRINRLQDALEEIVQRYEGVSHECDCDFEDVDYVCDYHLAKRALEAKP